jgi:isochorismate synthase EntC
MTPTATLTDEEMIVSSADYYVTESVLNPRASAGDIIRFARMNNLTAAITFQINQGGVQKIVVAQKTALKNEDAVKARKAIGMRSI